nr:uncharacterized protein LOC133596049 [Nerophis lumbriciformis]
MTDSTRRKLLAAGSAALVTSLPWLNGCSPVLKPNSSIVTPHKPLPRIAGFSGRVIERSDSQFAQWHSGIVWQARKPNRYPEWIVRPETLSDVRAAMKFAAANQLKVAARSGGHHVWGASVRQGGLLMDLSRFTQWKIHQGGTANFGPSLWARDVMAALEPADQAFPVAHCATVPLGGYALGGGLGLNGDQWGGMACNAIVGGTVVTSEGEVLTVSEREHDALLWGLRGGGGALPVIVTDLKVRTFNRTPGAWTSTWLFGLHQLDKALDLLDAVSEISPENTELLALMMHNPMAPPDAPKIQQKAVAVRLQVFVEQQSDADTLFDAIAANPSASHSVFRMGPEAESYEKLFSSSMDWRRGFGFGRFGVENGWTGQRRKAVMEVAKRFVDAPSWKSHVVIQPKLAPAVDGYGAFSVADDTYIGLYSVWDESERDGENLTWLKEVASALDRYSSGHYINEINSEDNPQRVRGCYSPDCFQRLRALRRQWDPDGVLHDFPGLS